MSEAKRIEGQMFLRGSVGWVVAIVLLLIAAGGTMLVGYLLNRWANAAGTMGVGAAAGMGVGGGVGGVAGAGTGWAGPMAGLPGPAVISVDSVKWPVSAGAPFREHWEKKQPGIGTLYQWYMDSGTRQGWQWGASISIPVQGENTYVIVVNLPRGFEPPDAPSGQIWVCGLGQSPGGDIMPNEASVRVRARLDAAQVKHLWEHDFPPYLVQDLIDAANGKGPLAAAAGSPAQAQQYQTLVPIDSYFARSEDDPSAPTPAEQPPE